LAANRFELIRMGARQLLQSFQTWRAAREPLVLATVYDTAGSTYSKAGHRILLAANGDYRGLVSGGCLEGDLAERARSVVATGRPLAVTYDLRDAADELWGLGIGCNGLLRVFLQPLLSANDYQPFAAMAELMVGTEAAGVATVIESVNPELPAGATAIAARSGERLFAGGRGDAVIAAAARAALGGAAARLLREHGGTILRAPLQPIPKLLVLGAGLDAIPLVAMAAELGWLVTVADHRPAYVARGGFDEAERTLVVEPEQLARTLRLADFDAVVVMSHHLATDRKYLRELAGVATRYLGVLGPRARRERLLGDLGDAGSRLRDRLKGPVGLDIGADSPESIALSILAELQSTLSGR
jgi:xanthine/CO dehydrogenase XdhC/CoxF family maturation factor